MSKHKFNEQEMRDSEPPKMETADDLRDYVQTLIEGEHDYGTCVYAMSLAAVAAYNLMAGHLGVTGFQAGCADMDIIRRTRRLDGPFALVNGNDGLYPQYDFAAKHPDLAESWREWFREEAQKKLSGPLELVHTNVLQHWQELAK